MISPVHSLGPGERVALWTQGCTKNCPGCISPELQPFSGQEIEESLLAQILIQTASAGGCRGLTVSGGDPLEQAEGLLRLLVQVRPHFDDILVYTGYTLEALRGGSCSDAARQCLNHIDVLIDGPYIHSRNHPGCVLRGSDNQVIHYLRPELAEVYRDYLLQGRKLETFSHNGNMIITGIPDRRENP